MATRTEPNYDSNYSKFMQTYSGQRLLEKHSLEEEGLWTIYGEDPNCDLGGPHVQPNLGTMEGALVDVIHAAVNLPSFWQWGGGGSIEKVDVQKMKGRTILVGKARNIGSDRTFRTTPEQLFALIKQRTEEGKISWTGTEFSSKLEGTVPGTGMSLSFKHTSDQRDGDWYQLFVTVNGKTTQCGGALELESLWKYIVKKPENDALAEAREILESL